MEAIKAIETKYNGYRFRSRLEARWAVFFHTLGLEFEYEKEGFELSSGRYLPDFWLPSMKAWVEIKPSGLDSCAIEKTIDLLVELSNSTGQAAYVVAGVPWMADLYANDSYESVGVVPEKGMGSCLWWARCEVCGTVGLTYMGNMADLSCKHLSDNHYFAAGGFDDPVLIDAFEKARAARFEHGEKG